MAERRRRLLLASNRGPVAFRVGDNGNIVARRGGGGLVTALGGLARHHEITWVSHAMSDGDVAAAEEAGGSAFEEASRDGSSFLLRVVGRPDTTFSLAYSAIANPLLWFVQHRLYGFGHDPVIDRRMHNAFRAYRKVNERIADALVEEAEVLDAREGDEPLMMVHDYHLFLVPGLVRARRPDQVLHFFLHIPWPDQGAWRCIPREWLAEFVESLLASDILGFQTGSDAQAFIRTAIDVLGARRVEGTDDAVELGGRRTLVRHYPISVAVEEFSEHVRSGTVQRLRRRLQEMRASDDGHLIVRVDRTDPSKNIVRGFRAFALMLHEHPELHQKVTLFCQLDPSRQDIGAYSRYLSQIQQAADDVNVQFSTGAWQPVFVNLDSNFLAAVAAYTEYDVLFVNPVADGMNLVSKEGPLVNERDGVLVLSQQAGAYAELGPHVVPVNPFDVAQQADALYEAITMSQDARKARAQALREQVQTHDVRVWIDSQLRDLTALVDARVKHGR